MEIAQDFGNTYLLSLKLKFVFELLGSHSENGDMVTYIILLIRKKVLPQFLKG